MKAIAHYLEHILWSTVKGFFLTGIGALIICFGVLFVTTPSHHLTLDVTSVLAAVVAFLAACLGGAVALIYRLSHIDEISHAVKRISEHHA
jgi:hypothetical protein